MTNDELSGPLIPKSNSTIDGSQRTAAKVAGFTCLFGMVIVIFANYAIYNPLIVPGSAAETARNIVAHQRLLRIAIACNITYCVGVVVLLAALYVILKPVKTAKTETRNSASFSGNCELKVEAKRSTLRGQHGE